LSDFSWKLLTTGRYAHNQTYVKNLIEKERAKLLKVVDVQGRTQQQKGVSQLIFLAVKAESLA
jgi:predicted TPR repeat methyltransferase